MVVITASITELGDCVLCVAFVDLSGMFLQPTTAKNISSPVKVDGCCVRDVVPLLSIV